MKKPTPADVLFGSLVIWTVLATVFIGRLEFTRRSEAGSLPDRSRAVRVKGINDIAVRGNSLGPLSASPALVVFGDFQCPYCKAFALVIDSLRQRHPAMRIVERHYPQPMLHAAAFSAALAAECAAKSGRYEAIRNVMYRDEDLVAFQDWEAIASEAGIDKPQGLRQCVESKQDSASVAQDIADGDRIGVRATPSFLIGDSLFVGTVGLSELESRLNHARKLN